MYIKRKLSSIQKKIIEFLHSEGMSISTLSRFLKFSKTTICRWIERLGNNYEHEVAEEINGEYQADELRTYVGNKKNESWIMYAISKTTRRIVSLRVGRRTKENLQQITNAVLIHEPKTICTDRLPMYGSLIPAHVHEVKERKTNHIERMNLQFRNQLKRLNRKTICFSKSENMLRSAVWLCVKYMTRGSNAYEFVL